MAVVVQLRTKIADSEVKKLIGKKCTNEDGALLADGDIDIYRPDGEPLFFLRRRWMPKEMCDHAYEALHHLRTYVSDNRASYTGGFSKGISRTGGAASASTRAFDENGQHIKSATAVIGYFDRQGGRFPFCRTTRFTATEVERWETVLPMVHRADELLKRLLPERHAAQKAACDRSHPSYIITGTAMSTVTVNNNAVAAVHSDKGDFADGFGVISCVRRGLYTGARLCFPQFRIGVDLEDGDTILFDAHALHGMTPMEKLSEDAERITSVYYFREKIQNCGSPDEERENAKRVRGKL